jgi:hypothetical protein
MPRLFQNFDIYPGYLAHLHRLAGRGAGYARIHEVFHNDRFVAVHMLKPTLERSSEAAFALGRDSKSQSDWARARGMPPKASAEEILLAQIEDHRTEIFYNHDPLAYGSAFIRRLPGSVRASIAWRAAPSPGADFGAYDSIVCNFPSILESYRVQGWRSAYFYPAHDPVMDDYNRGSERPIDLLFIGTYSRHHRRRARMIERIAGLSATAAVRLHLYLSPMTRLSETPLGLVGPYVSTVAPKRFVARLADPSSGGSCTRRWRRRGSSSTAPSTWLRRTGAICAAGKPWAAVRSCSRTMASTLTEWRTPRPW